MRMLSTKNYFRTVFSISLFLVVVISLHSQTIREAEVDIDGIVFPRMTTASRNALSPIQGQCIYHLNALQVECWDGSQWLPAATTGISNLVDTDGDTEINVETNPDDDEILFTIEGDQYGSIVKNPFGIRLFNLSNNGQQASHVIFGRDAGLNIDPSDPNSFCCNTLFGDETGRALTSGSTNVMMGTGAGRNSTTANANTFIGTDAGEANMVGFDNTFLGQSAGANNNSNSNVFIGHSAGGNSVAGAKNTIVGEYSGANTELGDGNVFVGSEAGRAAGSDGAGGFVPINNSIFIGKSAGIQAGDPILGMENAILIGTSAGEQNIASEAIAIGTNAGANNSALFNTFIGFNSGQSNSGEGNTLIGYNTGANVMFSGGDNVFVGTDAGNNDTSGDRNTFVGRSSGRVNASGTANTYIGAESGAQNDGEGNVFIGHQAGQQYDVGTSTEVDNTLVISNNSTLTPLIFGKFDTDDVKIHGTLAVEDNTNQVMNAYHDFSIGVNTLELSQVLKLRKQPGAPAVCNVTTEGAIYFGANGIVSDGLWLCRNDNSGPTPMMNWVQID